MDDHSDKAAGYMLAMNARFSPIFDVVETLEVDMICNRISTMIYFSYGNVRAGSFTFDPDVTVYCSALTMIADMFLQEGAKEVQ